MIPDPGQTDTPDSDLSRARTARRADLSDLGPRVLSGIVLVLVAVGTALLDGFSFALLWWLAALAIHWEWQRLLGPAGLARRLVGGSVVISIADATLMAGHPASAFAVLLVGAAAATVVGAAALPVWAGAGLMYAGVLPLSVQLLRGSEAYGLDAIFWLYAVVWGTDVMAYFGGRTIGGPKLWPAVSPSKTWSGFLIGIGCGAVAGLAAAMSWGGAHWPLLPLGLAVGVVAQAGDLFESALKRRFGIKDSSRLIPGHGGVMDRLDGFLSAAVIAVCFGMCRFGVESSAAGLLQW